MNKPNKLLSPDKTADPFASSNKKSIFLDVLYNQNRQISNILTVNRKIFSITNLMKENIFSNYFRIVNRDFTMISYYEDKAYYAAHNDSFTMSSVTTFWKEPKKFTGGNLKLKDFDIEIEVKNNMVIYMPSIYVHEVTPIIMEENVKGFGRYSMSQFLFVRNSAND